jgi:hypothetical protein
MVLTGQYNSAERATITTTARISSALSILFRSLCGFVLAGFILASYFRKKENIEAKGITFLQLTRV